MYEDPKVFEVTARMRTTVSTALCQQKPKYHYLVSQSSELCGLNIMGYF